MGAGVVPPTSKNEGSKKMGTGILPPNPPNGGLRKWKA